MFIESTLMKYGKGPPGGLIGITLNPITVKKWANGLHISTQILIDIDNLREGEHKREKIVHKEEMNSTIESDKQDRLKIKNALENCVDPLDPSQHPDELVNDIQV